MANTGGEKTPSCSAVILLVGLSLSPMVSDHYVLSYSNCQSVRY